jgi:hypothetical protein
MTERDLMRHESAVEGGRLSPDGARIENGGSLPFSDPENKKSPCPASAVVVYLPCSSKFVQNQTAAERVSDPAATPIECSWAMKCLIPRIA